jgi:hypothetical protein
MAVWYSLWAFVIYFPIWYVCTKEKSGNPAKNQERKWNLTDGSDGWPE